MNSGGLIMKLTEGMAFPNFTVNTSREDNVDLYSRIDRKTVFWVIRYIGCTVCRYDVHVLAENYERIREKGCQLFVVMQSDTDHVRRELKDANIPFEIICDNEFRIYNELEINPAASPEELRGENVEALKEKGGKARALGFSHGDYEGNELQLPALFIVDEKCNVLKAHYGTNILDMPSVDELVEMI